MTLVATAAATHPSLAGPAASRNRRRLLRAVPAGVALVAVSACGGGSSTGSAQPAASASASRQAPTQGQGQGRRQLSGVSGLVADISGFTLQVQGNNAQTAVTYGVTTTFTNTVPSALSDVAVGMCVTVRSAGTSAAPTGTPVTAGSVALSSPVNGSCTRGGGGAGGTRSSGGPQGTVPSGSPRRSGRPGGGGGFPAGGGVTGMVATVSGSTFTVDARSRGGQAPSASPTGTGGGTTVSTAVTTTPTTTYTRMVAATSSALAVGRCVTALGPAGDTGAIAATSIAVRSAVNGTCTNGFRGRGGQGGPAATGGSTGG